MSGNVKTPRPGGDGECVVMGVVSAGDYDLIWNKLLRLLYGVTLHQQNLITSYQEHSTKDKRCGSEV